MKKIVLATFILFLGMASFAQQNETGKIQTKVSPKFPFLFDKFVKSKIYFTDFSQSTGQVNINLSTNKLYFLEGDKLNQLEDQSNLKMVIIDKNMFIYKNNAFYHRIFEQNTTLLIKYSVKFKDSSNKKGAYGTDLSTSAVNEISTYYNNSGTSAVVDLETDKEARSIGKAYFLMNEKGRIYPANKKNILKIYKKKKSQIKEHLANTKFDFESETSLVELIDYCETL